MDEKMEMQTNLYVRKSEGMSMHCNEIKQCNNLNAI